MGNHELTCIKMSPKVKNNFLKVQIVLILANFICSEAKVSDQRLCADPDCSGEEADALKDNPEQQLNDDIVPINTHDNNDETHDQWHNENEQLIGDGDVINSMDDVDIVSEEEIEVEPAGKELDATFYDKDDIVVNESSKIIEKLEEPVEINSADNLMNENDLMNENVSEGQETADYGQTGEMNQVEYVEPTRLEEDASTPSPDLVNLSGEEGKKDPLQDSQLNDFQNFGNDQLAKKDFYQTSSESFIPEWLTVIAHDQGFINSDRLALVGIIAITLLLLHFINTFMDRSTREKPLIRKLAEMDRKLFASSNELLILKKEMAENGGSTVDAGASAQIVREMEMQVEQVRLELETSRETVKKEGDRYNMTLSQLELSRQDVITAQEEARQAQEMVEEMLANQKDKTGGGDDKLLEVVQQLQTQLESQKNMLQKYEPKLKKKEKENKELTKQLKQMRADVANANLETEKMKKDLSETYKVKEECSSKLEEISKNEGEWQSLTDLLQSQLDEKSETVGQMETEMSSLRSRISVFKNESESKEEQLEILQETFDELQNRKSNKKETKETDDADGWEVEEEGWGVEEVNEIKEVAKLRIENKKNSELKEALEHEVTEIKSQLDSASNDLDKYRTEASTLREARDEVIKEQTDVQRRLDVLTEFFNKKEAELQKQLGLQSAKFGDVSIDAESTARQLISVNNELESTQGQLKIIKGELDDQERSLKASVAGQEKKAHENWVAARQAERKLTELQGEMSLMRNKLTVVESKNSLLEQEKGDLAETVNLLRTSVKSEPVTTNGVHTSGSLDSLSLGQGDIPGSGPNSVTSASYPTSPSGPESLPPLPGLPGISSLSSGLPTSMPGMTGMPLLANPMGMVPPMFQPGGMLPGIPPMLEMRQPPLGRMSPGPRDRSNRSISSRSPSPEYERYRGGSGRYSSNRDRDMSPSSRSERRTSPSRRGPSPTRSERNFRDRQYQPDYNRDRYYNRSNRDTSPDRYSTRSEQSERESPRESQRYRDRTGPKTSTPGDPQPRSYRA